MKDLGVNPLFKWIKTEAATGSEAVPGVGLEGDPPTAAGTAPLQGIHRKALGLTVLLALALVFSFRVSLGVGGGVANGGMVAVLVFGAVIVLLIIPARASPGLAPLLGPVLAGLIGAFFGGFAGVTAPEDGGFLLQLVALPVIVMLVIQIAGVAGRRLTRQVMGAAGLVALAVTYGGVAVVASGQSFRTVGYIHDFGPILAISAFAMLFITAWRYQMDYEVLARVEQRGGSDAANEWFGALVLLAAPIMAFWLAGEVLLLVMPRRKRRAAS